MLSSVQYTKTNDIKRNFIFKRMFILCSCSYHHRSVSQYLFVCHSTRFYFQPLTFNLLIMRFRVLIILFQRRRVSSTYIFRERKRGKNKRKALLKSKRQKIKRSAWRASKWHFFFLYCARYKKNSLSFYTGNIFNLVIMLSDVVVELSEEEF